MSTLVRVDHIPLLPVRCLFLNPSPFLWADPFDRPDNFPELVVNRIQASVKLLEAQPKPEVRFNKSLFGQLFGEMDGWANEKFRRCVNPTH